MTSQFLISCKERQTLGCTVEKDQVDRLYPKICNNLYKIILQY